MLRNRLLAAARKAKAQEANSSHGISIAEVYAAAAAAKIYEDLPLIHLDGSKTIRLLHLLPGLQDDPLRCKLSTHTLDDGLEFEALSYAWRDSRAPSQEPSIPVRVNDLLILVLPNLGNALKCLRLQDRSRALWVDFLCINQARILEVDHQVGLMGTIYETAQQVVAFMGIESATTENANQLLQELSPGNHLSEVASFEASASALGVILMNDWWHRLWTVQESILAKKLTLQLGMHSIPWDLMKSALDYLSIHIWEYRCCYVWLLSHGNLFQDVTQFLHIARTRGPQQKSTYITSDLFFSALNHIQDKASDPRDHVFGLIGLVSPENRLIEPDHSLTASQLFTKVALSAINKMESLDYLMYKHYEFTQLEIPSWVIDLSLPDDRDYLRLAYGVRWVFSAGSKSKPSFNIISEKRISCKGWLVDTISNIQVHCPEEPYAVTDHKSAKILHEQVKNIKQLGHELLSPISNTYDSSHLHPLLRTASFGVIDTATEYDKNLIDGIRRYREDDYPRAEKMISILEEYVAEPEETPVELLLSRFEETNTVKYGTSLFFGVFAGSFFLTREEGKPRKMGMGPRAIRVGDRIAIFKGVSMPLVIRKMKDTEDDKYELIGVAYLDEAMDGIVDGVCLEDIPCSDIELV